MKKILLLSFLLMFFVACGEETAESNNDTVDAITNDTATDTQIKSDTELNSDAEEDYVPDNLQANDSWSQETEKQRSIGRYRYK
jgi:uncharacterized protein YcfL